MSWRRVEVIFEPALRQLCRRAYPGHPKGCPNYGTRASCPPKAPLFSAVFDTTQPIYAVWTTFDLAAHVAKMRQAHPCWTDRQLVCCLYWQQSARRRLKDEITAAKIATAKTVCICPEATGVDVTATMQKIGAMLEWPPRTITYQVALIGTANGDNDAQKA